MNSFDSRSIEVKCESLSKKKSEMWVFNNNHKYGELKIFFLKKKKNCINEWRLQSWQQECSGQTK